MCHVLHACRRIFRQDPSDILGYEDRVPRDSWCTLGDIERKVERGDIGCDAELVTQGYQKLFFAALRFHLPQEARLYGVGGHDVSDEDEFEFPHARYYVHCASALLFAATNVTGEKATTRCELVVWLCFCTREPVHSTPSFA